MQLRVQLDIVLELVITPETMLVSDLPGGTKIGPRKQIKTQVDDPRVKDVIGLIELQSERLVHVKLADPRVRPPGHQPLMRMLRDDLRSQAEGSNWTNLFEINSLLI